jgi:hypothetical protein
VVYFCSGAHKEAVDLDVVRTLRARDRYVDALLEEAQINGRVRLTPSASFVWHGQLARRIATLFAQNKVSVWRRNVSVACVIAGTLFVLRAALVYFPARSTVHAQTSGAQPIVIESGGDHLLRRGALEYPRWVQDEHVEGLVEVQVSTDKMGRVLDARVLDGPQELRRPVLRSVLDWQYDPQAKPPGTYQIAVRFTLPEPGYSGSTAITGFAGASVESNIKPGVFLFVPSGLEPGAIEQIKKMTENTARAERGELTGKITRIQTHGAAERMDLHLPVALGDRLSPETILRVEQSLRGIDRQFVLGLETGPGDSIAMHIFSSVEQRQNEDRR